MMDTKNWASSQTIHITVNKGDIPTHLKVCQQFLKKSGIQPRVQRFIQVDIAD